jgi:hypothetical protein
LQSQYPARTKKRKMSYGQIVKFFAGVRGASFLIAFPNFNFVFS